MKLQLQVNSESSRLEPGGEGVKLQLTVPFKMIPEEGGSGRLKFPSFVSYLVPKVNLCCNLAIMAST